MSGAKELLRVPTGDGKYTVVQDADGKLGALRYDSEWRRDLTGDNLVLSLAQDLSASRAREKALVEALRAAAQTIALVRKGIRQRAIKDVGMISTNLDAPTLDVQPLSAILDAALTAASQTLLPSTPSPDMPSDCHPQGE